MKGGVRERTKGKWSYYFKYKDELDRWKTKEKGGFSSRKEAQTALRKAITEFEEEGFLSKKIEYTLEQYMEYWFENVASLNLRYNTLRSYRGPLLSLNMLNKLILKSAYFTASAFG